MSEIGYGDYAFSSEEEIQQVEGQEHMTDTGCQQDDNDLDSNGSISDPNQTSDEDDSSNEGTDIDEYASFFTDYEKYQYDQVRWAGISNPRKYSIASRKVRGKGEGQKKSQRTTKPEKQDKPRLLKKSRRKSTGKAETSLEPIVTIPKDGEIHFDSRENLWYSYRKQGILVSERATYHHWIRADLSRDENLKGSYAFPRQRGPGNLNVTCFNAVQQHWGLQRPHYAPVMFEWERLSRRDPTYQLDSLYYQGLLVIDYWHMPIRAFREIPLVISSAFEGGFMEPATRLHSELAYEDIRARMPPFIEMKPLSKASTFSGRSRHFREHAGAIAWEKKEGSDNIKIFIENIVRPVNNLTHGSRDLTNDEVKKLRLMNCGSKPGRARAGTSKESKERYIAGTRKAAGLTPTTTSKCKANLDLHEERGEQSTASKKDGNQEDESTLVYNAPRRFVFCCTKAPFLQAMTEKEAFMQSWVDMLDPRNQVPKFSNEVNAIRDALKVTVDHFKDIFGFEPVVYEGSNYISEYCNIQDQMDEFFLEDATALRRLRRWEGRIFDWEWAEVEQDPCIGRRQCF